MDFIVALTWPKASNESSYPQTTSSSIWDASDIAYVPQKHETGNILILGVTSESPGRQSSFAILRKTMLEISAHSKFMLDASSFVKACVVHCSAQAMEFYQFCGMGDGAAPL